MIQRKFWLAATVAVGAICGASGARAAQCADLNNIGLPLDGRAEQVSLTAEAVAPSGFFPGYCKVTIAISSNARPEDSLSNSVIVLPDAERWNGRFLGTGNGGFAGSFSPLHLLYLAQGYAAANTDMGTAGQDNQYGCTALYCGSKESIAKGQSVRPGGLFERPGAIRDFGYASTHLMTLAAKQLILAYYGRGANYSYFHGCSTGGSQALMEAQRFPADYDAIIAGSPAYNRTHLHIAGASLYQPVHATPDAYLTRGALTLAHNAVLASCAGQDGGLASDPFLTRPYQCTVGAKALTCTGAPAEVPCTDPNATSCTCLTPAQARGVNGIWTGARDSRNRVLYPGYARGAEVPELGNAGPFFQESLDEPAFNSLLYWAFGPDFDWKTLFARTDVPQPMLAAQIGKLDRRRVGSPDDTGTSTFEQVLNSTSADLSAFNARGGKLMMYAGYDDPLIPSASSIAYANAVAERDPTGWKSYLRLFLAPGMWHCGGGPGGNAFGNATGTLPPALGNPDFDIVAATVAWREQGRVPTSIVATKYVGDSSGNGIAFQRPLCPYPRYAKYQGGDATQAAAWKCVPGLPITKVAFDPVYGPK